MTAFATAKDAKVFLIDRVREQATSEGRRLTPAEEFGLAISVEDVEVDQELEQAFDRECHMEDFEKWTRGLIERALQQDRELRPQNVGLWEDAYSILKRGDHYILVMLKPVMRPGLFRRLSTALRS